MCRKKTKPLHILESQFILSHAKIQTLSNLVQQQIQCSENKLQDLSPAELEL